jgi:hypothetical protein
LAWSSVGVPDDAAQALASGGELVFELADAVLGVACLGGAVPFVIGRHVHRAVAPPPPPAADPTGIDYLGMVAAAHDEEAGTGMKIDFTRLQLLPPGNEDCDG